MAKVMKISSQRQVRIPKQIMKMLMIETGDFVEIGVQKDQIILKPRKLIDPTQGWYWTKEWQAMEVDVDKELAVGETSSDFETAEEGVKWLEK